MHCMAKVKIYVVCGRNKYGVRLLLGTGAGQTKHDKKGKAKLVHTLDFAGSQKTLLMEHFGPR